MQFAHRAKARLLWKDGDASIKIALMRPEGRAEASLDYCRKNGMEPVVAPAIEISDTEIDRQAVLSWLEKADTCIFMSSTAVDRFFSSLNEPDLLTREGLSIVAVGSATANRLSLHSVVSTMPDVHSSEGLVRYVASLRRAGGPVVVFRSDSGTETLKRGLEATGLVVIEFALYRIRMPEDTSLLEAVLGDILGGERYILPFSSSMMARNFFKIAEGMGEGEKMSSALGRCSIWAIGAETAREIGSHISSGPKVASSADFESMLQEIVDAAGGMNQRTR